jgi:sulfatase maturation enzyme AslB (radical SAM superfamily)
MLEKKSYCAAFWNHTNIRGDNRIFPCCRYKTPVATFNGDVDGILNLPVYSTLRQRSIEGPIEGCQKCYYEESLGKKSLRQTFNETYSIDTVELKYLEIGFDNICNLTCDGCWAEFSSAWADKENPLGKKSNITAIEEITKLPNTLKKIVFLGGEPLMTNRHMKLLSMVEHPELVEITYYTNGSFLLNLDEIAVLNKFKQVEIILSIDGYKELNEQVRSGSIWTDILAFINQIKTTKFKFVVHSVIHLNNWHGVTDLADFIKEIDVEWTTNILTYPAKLDIINLTSDKKTQFLKLLDSIDIPNKEYVLKHLEQRQVWMV